MAIGLIYPCVVAHTHEVAVTDMCRTMVDRARRFADDRLFAAASVPDIAVVPPTHLLDELRDHGFYGIFSPVRVGGSELPSTERHLVIEAFASGCLTTTFIWQQHGAAAAATAGCSGEAARFAPDLAAGRLRAGVAFAHLLRSGPPSLVATPAGDGWTLDGVAPYVTGWGHVDLVLVAARHDTQIVWVLVDGVATDSVSPARLHLLAVDGSSTHTVRFAGHRVPADRVVGTAELDEWLDGYRAGLRTNGSLALGVADRARRLLGDGSFEEELSQVRRRLDTASVIELPEARADATILCVNVTSALLASCGGAAVIDAGHAQRLAREAMFLLVQGQTRAIRDAQLRRLKEFDPAVG